MPKPKQKIIFDESEKVKKLMIKLAKKLNFKNLSCYYRYLNRQEIKRILNKDVK